jgi:hypothetical protein
MISLGNILPLADDVLSQRKYHLEERMTARSPKVSSKESETAGREASPKSARRRMHAALEREADALTLKLIEMAKAGDVACLKLCIERLYPPHKAAPPPLESIDEVKSFRCRIFDRLRVPVLCDPALAADVERIAQDIVRECGARFMDLARRIAEAEVDVLRVRRVRDHRCGSKASNTLSITR